MMTDPEFLKEQCGMNRSERRALKKRVGAKRYAKLERVRKAREAQAQLEAQT